MGTEEEVNGKGRRGEGREKDRDRDKCPTTTHTHTHTQRSADQSMHHAQRQPPRRHAPINLEDGASGGQGGVTCEVGRDS
jgi:hypothetical protein